MSALRHKYGAVRTEAHGFKFASKAEERFYRFLLAERAAGAVLFWLMQVPFHLPGGVRYVVDYQIFQADGSIRFVDVKGVETEAFKVKKRVVEATFPGVVIEVVKA